MSVTTNILQRTFHMRHGKSTGTCFTMDKQGRRYLVTARHLVGTINHRDKIDIQHDGKWIPVEVELVAHGEDDVDISLLAPKTLFGASHPLVVTTANLSLAEDVFFLGFPYGEGFDVGELNYGYPLPLVKRATVSAMHFSPGWILLDGHNNPGFSGGPVVRRWNGSEQVVVGVVSGYRAETVHVVDSENNPGPYKYFMNTGIVKVYDSKKINELIASNPVGTDINP